MTDIQDTEHWLPVLDWGDLYEVSDLGRVRSLARVDRLGRPVKGIVLQAKMSPRSRYRTVRLCKDGYELDCRIGRLVAEAFISPCPPGEELCHGPNGRLDDSLVNVSWGTHKKNNGPDKLRDGTLLRGERANGAKLTEADVIEIRALYASELHLPRWGNHGRAWTLDTLAKKYSVGRKTIHRVVRGERYGHGSGN